jgi:hypothetical protein
VRRIRPSLCVRDLDRALSSFGRFKLYTEVVIDLALDPVRDVVMTLRNRQDGIQDELEQSYALDALRRVAEPSAFEALLDQLIQDEDGLAQVAQMSYHHVLGFDKIVLMSALPSCRLRLHIWWPSGQRGVEHPHNHRYSSHSVVVAGRLRMHMYELGDIGQLVTHYQEGGVSEDGRWSFVRMGTAHLRTKMVTDIYAGKDYSMSADVVHRITPPRELTVTLFLEMNRVRSSSAVFVRPEDSVPKSQLQQSFSISQLRDRLCRLRIAKTGADHYTF